MTMFGPRPSPFRRARTALAWSLLLFVCVQLGLNVLMETLLPGLRDVEIGVKTTGLRALLNEERGRPLLMVVGSSRAAMDLRPDVLLDAWPASETPPAIYNYALSGYGPVMELASLQRLLREGARPDWLVVEVTPPFLCQEGPHREEHWIPTERLGWNDLSVMRRFAAESRTKSRHWLKSRLVPAYSYRLFMMSWLAPDWLPPWWLGVRRDYFQGLDRHGWMAHHEKPTEAEYQRGLRVAYTTYANRLQHFRLSEAPDRALRELLGTCHREGIRALLVTYPEGTEFQGWYAPGAAAAIDTYLAQLRGEYQVPWVNARSWMPDDCFLDGHHLYPEGAALFTERLGREVIQPWLQSDSRRQLEHKTWVTRQDQKNSATE